MRCPVPITTQTRKALWARSGNRCAICDTQLALAPLAGRATLIGQECHIVARSPGGPRAGLEVDDVDGIDNLILLCGNCHRLVDEQPEVYTVDRLRGAKREHEARIETIDIGAAPRSDAQRRTALEAALRESRARCAQRWQALGVSYDLAAELAADPAVGALPKDALASGPVTILVGDVGAGKSLAGERLHQAAIAAALDHPASVAPVWLRALNAAEASLDEVVTEATTLLGGDDATPVVLVIDGLDEAGPVAAAHLLGDARMLAHTRPGSSVVLTTRVLSEVGNDDERMPLPPLDEEQARALMARLASGAGHRWFTLAPALREAARRPLFAIASAVLMRDGEQVAAPADVIDRLVRRTLGDRWQALRDPLIDLAVASIRRDGAPVRPQDVVPAHTLDDLLATRIVIEERGRLRFPLILFAQWFAAHGVLDGRVDLDHLLPDAAALENWRYPLSIAVAVGPTTRAAEILDTLTRAQPGFAALVLAESAVQVPGAATDVHDPLEAGAQLRRAAQSWLDGLGALAPYVVPVDEDGDLPPLGIDISDGQLTAAWLSSPQHNDTVVLPRWRSLTEIPSDWGQTRRGTPVPGPAWPWVWMREGVAKRLADLLKRRALPVGGSPLEHEALWDIATRLVEEREGRDLPVEHLLTLDPLRPPCIRDEPIDVWSLQAALPRHIPGAVLQRPWRTREEILDAEGPEGWARHADAVFRMALDGYTWWADRLFASLASRLTTAGLLPARAGGIVSPVSDTVNWWLEALPVGRANEAAFTASGKQYDVESVDEQSRRRDQNARLLRPHAARWIHTPWQIGPVRLDGRAPATNLAVTLLWDDLVRLRFTKAGLPEWSYWDLPDLREPPP
jgi:hypothetical protein